MPVNPVVPPTYTPIPTPPTTASPSDFDVRADNFLGGMPQLQTDLAAIAANVYGNAQKTVTNATESATSATSSTTQADLALTRANAAASSATSAGTSASTAAARATDSATSAGQSNTYAMEAKDYRDQTYAFGGSVFVANSSTSFTPSLGSKSLTIETGKGFGPGTQVLVSSKSDESIFIAGQVTSYNNTTGAFVVNATSFGGSTAKGDWSVVLSARLDGVGATGTWPISITGNAATCTSLGFSKLTNIPTTLALHGITNGVTTDTTQVLTGTKRSTKGLAVSNTAGMTDPLNSARCLQITTDIPNFGGLHDDHAGFILYSVMPGGWGTAEARFAISNGVGTYNTTNPALIISNAGITAASNVTSLSDGRLKKDIEPIQGALYKCNLLRGVYYSMKDDATNRKQMGVIAQDVQKIVPEVVSEIVLDAKSGETVLAVSYPNLVGLLISAINELTQEVNKLKLQVNSKE